MTVSPSELVFEGTGALTVAVSGDGCDGALLVTAQASAGWISVVPRSVSIPSGGSAQFTVSVAASAPPDGGGRVQLSSEAGVRSVVVTVDRPDRQPTADSTGTPPCSSLICPTPPPQFTPRD
jgi:hypothetical protein